MSAALKVDFNRDILNKLIKSVPDLAVTLNTKFPKIEKWLKGEEKPTMRQLGNLAKQFKIPFGYFFLNQFPVRKYPIPHYRTNDNTFFTPSLNLYDTVSILQKRQQWAKDLLDEWGNKKLPFAECVTLQTPIPETVNIIRNIFNIETSWAEEFPTWNKAFHALMQKTEKTGIFVVLNGIFENNTYRKLDVKEFRGFVLYDEVAPFIFINNNDAISGKIFTLIHEINHILLGQSASFDLRTLQPAENEIEKYCNICAAEFLVPEKLLKDKFLLEKMTDYYKLAKIFKVSAIVISRRLLDLNLITKDVFFDFYNKHIKQEYKIRSVPGGNFYHTIPYRLSNRFLTLVSTALRQGSIFHRDAYRITGLKAHTFEEIQNKLGL